MIVCDNFKVCISHSTGVCTYVHMLYEKTYIFITTKLPRKYLIVRILIGKSEVCLKTTLTMEKVVFPYLQYCRFNITQLQLTLVVGDYSARPITRIGAASASILINKTYLVWSRFLIKA